MVDPTSTEITVAIDPGANGGIAWHFERSVVSANLPETPHELTELFQELQREGAVRLHLEEVGGYAGGAGSPGSAMFNFGRNYGQILGVAAALGIPVELVRPQKWQKALSLGTSAGLTKTQWKNKLKARAAQLFPEQKVTLLTADALLILHAALKKLI